MKLYNNRQNINFKAGLTPQHIDFIKNLNVSKVASELQQRHGISCRFNKNSLVAGLTTQAVDIFDKLGAQKPKQVQVFDFKSPHINISSNLRNSIGYVTFSDTDPMKSMRVNFNKMFFDLPHEKLPFWDLYFDNFKIHSGTDHVLQAIIHEFVHVNHYAKLKDSIRVSDIKKMTDLKFLKFWDEASQKLGYYSVHNPFELYTNYWTKEICESLDDKWHPRYNPFETPQIKLSSKLRDFIDAVDKLDIQKASTLAKNWDDFLEKITMPDFSLEKVMEKLQKLFESKHK